MCLLIVASRLDPHAPLVVGANRDEQYDRPAVAVTVLQERVPRVVGGRDLMAGGTWLAVNEHGVVAALTNGPSPDGRDPSKRSRGELPLALAQHADAGSAVADFVERFRPRDYNRAWLLVGDRTSLHYIDMTGDDVAGVRSLPPGLHILGNGPIDVPSVKVEHVKIAVTATVDSGADWRTAIRTVLSDHTVPEGAAEELARRPANGRPQPLPLSLAAACVHTDKHGTRSSAVVSIPADPGAPPLMAVADGPPCTTPFVDVVGLLTRSEL